MGRWLGWGGIGSRTFITCPAPGPTWRPKESQKEFSEGQFPQPRLPREKWVKQGSQERYGALSRGLKSRWEYRLPNVTGEYDF